MLVEGVEGMKFKKDLSVLAFCLLACILTAGLILSVQDLARQLAGNSILRVYPAESEQIRGVAAAVEAVGGVAAVNLFDSDQAAAEFEAVVGYPWPGEDPLPEYIDVAVEPEAAFSAAAAIETIDGVEFVAYRTEIFEQIVELDQIFKRTVGLLVLLFISTAVYGLIYGVRMIKEREHQCAA